MPQLAWLDDHDLAFPDPRDALKDPNGLLAVGGDLSPARLLNAYRHGIFPWYDDDQPILWWSPEPRCVIDPRTFRPSRSLGRKLRAGNYEIRIDTVFEAVIDACSDRQDDAGTWITSEMRDAYINLHNLGYAHSVECYIEGTLAGGLYGVGIGPLFFGESMFHRVTDASKIAFAYLMGMMRESGCPLVDCQIENPHLTSLGAAGIPRDTFLNLLERYVNQPPIDWNQLSDAAREEPRQFL